jgi:hypothetical protein
MLANMSHAYFSRSRIPTNPCGGILGPSLDLSPLCDWLVYEGYSRERLTSGIGGEGVVWLSLQAAFLSGARPRPQKLPFGRECTSDGWRVLE